MNWEQIEGQMKQVGGRLKAKWAKLTDDDLLLLKGKKETFLGKLQERSGLAKEEAEKQFDAFLASIEPAAAKIDKAISSASPK
jgi:uncharacterized protein YjbJ (UPF0337 family)